MGVVTSTGITSLLAAVEVFLSRVMAFPRTPASTV
jgi:hypothetical protein